MIEPIIEVLDGDGGVDIFVPWHLLHAQSGFALFSSELDLLRAEVSEGADQQMSGPLIDIHADAIGDLLDERLSSRFPCGVFLPLQMVEVGASKAFDIANAVIVQIVIPEAQMVEAEQIAEGDPFPLQHLGALVALFDMERRRFGDLGDAGIGNKPALGRALGIVGCRLAIFAKADRHLLAASIFPERVRQMEAECFVALVIAAIDQVSRQLGIIEVNIIAPRQPFDGFARGLTKDDALDQLGINPALAIFDARLAAA